MQRDFAGNVQTETSGEAWELRCAMPLRHEYLASVLDNRRHSRMLDLAFH